MRFEQGTPSKLIKDSNQDGIPDIEADYDKGVLQTVSLSGDTDIFIEYEHFPWVKRITRRDGDRIIVYNLWLGALSIAFPRINIIEELPSAEIKLPEWEIISGKAEKIVIYVPGEESPREEYTPLAGNRGRTVFRSSDESGYYRVFYIRDGQVSYEEQDLTGAPGFDTVRYYRDGFLELIAHDAGEDGVFEYSESVETPDGAWFYWDYNENGNYDCRELRTGGRILREYSSGDDGNYDILIEFEA